MKIYDVVVENADGFNELTYLVMVLLHAATSSAFCYICCSVWLLESSQNFLLIANLLYKRIVLSRGWLIRINFIKSCTEPEIQFTHKFVSNFQLATAALLIYSTLAAIYYSKVNPLTSDYDYVDYLSRSFKGRSMSEDSADVEDEGAIESGRTYLSSLAHNNWVKAAAYGFQFAMDAIDKVPK